MTSSTPVADPSRASLLSQTHVPALDGMRGLAIVGVLLFHLWGVLAPVTFLQQAWLRIICVGWSGVDLFFVLSGFLITGILIDSRDSPHYFRNFYMRRVLRIFPLYYGFLALLFLTPRLPDIPAEPYTELCRHQSWLWLYLQNFSIVFEGRTFPCQMNHLWSLAVEEQFYLVWPLLVYLCPRKRLLGLTVAAILLSLLSRVLWLQFRLTESGPYFLPFLRMDGFAAGALVAWCLRNEAGRRFLVCWSKPAAVGSLLVILLGFLCANDGCLMWSTRGMQMTGYTVLAIFFAALLTRTVLGPPTSLVNRLFLQKPLLWLGKYSYGIYVFHFPVHYLLCCLGPRLLRELPAVFGSQLTVTVIEWPWIMPTLGTLATLLLAYLSWHLYEKQFLKLKRFFPQRQSGSPSRNANSPCQPLVHAPQSRCEAA